MQMGRRLSGFNVVFTTHCIQLGVKIQLRLRYYHLSYQWVSLNTSIIN